MLYSNEDAFAKAGKQGVKHCAYLLYGSENFLIEKWAAALLKQHGQDSAFNLHRFDGRKPDLDAVYEAVEAFPLMAQTKLVYLDNLDYAKLNGEDQKKLAEILSDIPKDCILLASAKAPGFDQKSAAGKKLIALFDKAGCAVELGSRGPSGLLTFLRSTAGKNGCSLSPEVGRYILEICENDMTSLYNEIAKICAYAGGGEITKAQVDAVAIPKTEARIFDLQKRILSGDTQGAMTLLDDLFYLRENPVAILGVLGRAYVDLYRAKIARDNGVSPQDVASRFGYKGREFLVRNAFSASAGLSAGYLRRALDILYGCDKALKSTGIEEQTLLEQTVVQLFLLDKKQV